MSVVQGSVPVVVEDVASRRVVGAILMGQLMQQRDGSVIYALRETDVDAPADRKRVAQRAARRRVTPGTGCRS